VLLRADAEVGLVYPDREGIPVRDEDPGADIKLPCTLKEKTRLHVLLHYDALLPAAPLRGQGYDVLERVKALDPLPSRPMPGFNNPNISQPIHMELRMLGD